jgi:hypothetical protein
MAEVNTRVMDMVRRELEKNRSVANEDLFTKAKKIDPSLSRLDIRQFHAKYPLQVKRALSGGRRGGRPAGTGARKRGRPPGKTAAAAPAKAARKTGTGRPRGRPRKTAIAAAPPGIAATGSGRDAVRGLLLQFARQVAGADGKADVVDVLTSLDGWVDRMMSAATR